MPGRTKKTKTTEPTGPSQSQLARLIQDSFDLLSSEIVNQLVSEQKFSDEQLKELKNSVSSRAQDMKNRTIDQLIKYY